VVSIWKEESSGDDDQLGAAPDVSVNSEGGSSGVWKKRKMKCNQRKKKRKAEWGTRLSMQMEDRSLRSQKKKMRAAQIIQGHLGEG
jgi:hypothetical protein